MPFINKDEKRWEKTVNSSLGPANCALSVCYTYEKSQKPLEVRVQKSVPSGTEIYEN